MCGIFGYVGKSNNAAQIVFEGLKLLEYRGYDSWGIAIKNQKSKIPLRSEASKNQKLQDKDQFIVEKHVGKIEDKTLNSQLLTLNSHIAIGHTRWATHGGVTIENTHPHLDCTKKIAVLHNGIVENYQDLKESLLKKGHIFTSETDTEVIPHLIEEYLKKEGFTSSVRDTFNLLKGLNAIVVAYAPSKQIIAAKTGSPLVVGVNDKGYYIASDSIGILPHTRRILFLKDREMVILDSSIQLLSLPSGIQLIPQFEKVDWKIDDVKRGKFAHFMIKEINEQPQIIRNIAKNYIDQVKALSSVVRKAQGTFFIGAGTAFHACLAGNYLFSKIARIHVNTMVASEFNYLEDFLTEKSLIVALSQSGETIDVLEPLTRAQEKKSTVAALVNSLGSSIYRLANYKLLLGAGPEKAVASTKAYIAKLSVLFLLAFEMIDKIKQAQKLLLDAAEEVERLLQKNNLKKIMKLAKMLKSVEHIYAIGRGMSFSTALEAALKIKEVSYIHTEGLAGGELKHGTIALISKGTPCIVFAPFDETYEVMISNAMEIKSRGGLVIGVSPKNSSVFDYWIEVKDCKEASIIPQIVPFQLLGYFLALEKGNDPDKPRNLAKSVTVK